MNSEEIKQQFDTLLPAEVNGSARPSEPISSDNDFYLNVPQLIRNDVVLADSMNLIISTLLSNDKVLNAMIDAIKDQLASADLREATQLLKGLMSPADKKKLDGIATNANNYTHPNSGVASGTYKSVTVNAQGHVTGGSNPTTLAGYGITDAAAKSHGNHVPATQTADNTKFLRNDNTWQQVTPGNIGAPTKTGSGASGTWNINVSGKATTAGTADTANKFAGFSKDAFVHFDNNITVGSTWKTNAVVKVEGTLPDNMTGVYQYGVLASFSTANACLQLYGAHHPSDGSNIPEVYVRSGWGTDKKPWTRMLTAANINSYAPTKTGGGASGTWGISITGTAANVTQKKSATAVTHTGYGTNNNYVPDMAFMAFWNGAFNSSNSSNLKYCCHGEIIGSNTIDNYQAQLSGVSYVTEAKYNSDGSWYRKYSDGWLEQGAPLIQYSSGETYKTVTVTLLKPFKNTNYTVLKTLRNVLGTLYSGGVNSDYISAFDFKTTSFNTFTGNPSNSSYGRLASSWYAYGQG